MPDIRSEHDEHLPNTLLLELFLEERFSAALEPAAASRLCRKIIDGLEEFASNKFRRDTVYSLLSVKQLRLERREIGTVLDRAVDCGDQPLHFISREMLARGTEKEWRVWKERPGERARVVRERQKRFLSIAQRRSLRRLIRWPKPLDGYADREGRTLENIVRLSIGTLPLMASLDHGFGNAFSNVFKNDIVSLWCLICVSFLEGEADRVEALLPLAAKMRWTFPIALLQADDRHPMTLKPVQKPLWLMMAD